jgi:hypothetical protein
MKIIKKKEDIYEVKNPHHKHGLLEYFKEIMEPIYKDSSPDGVGWLVYFEEGDDLFGINPEIGFHNKHAGGIYHEIFPGTPGWEAVENYNEMFLVTVIMNNEFAMTYFIPDEGWVDPILLRTLKDESIGNLILEEIEDVN